MHTPEKTLKGDGPTETPATNAHDYTVAQQIPVAVIGEEFCSSPARRRVVIMKP
jgi:hypothetical protein